jgi:signal transduction histidine kinase
VASSNPEQDDNLASTLLTRQWIYLGSALLVLGGFMGWSLFAEHGAIEARELERLATQAKVIDDNLGHQLRATNNVFNSLLADLPYLIGQKDGKSLVNHRLHAMTEAMPGLRTLLILDADGTATASDREQLVGQNFGEREYFQVARQAHNPAMLHVAPPFKTYFGIFSIPLSKAMLDEQGKFAGVIMASLNPEYFNTLLDSIRYAPDMATSLINYDGKLFLVRPEKPGLEGTDVAKPGSFFSRHRESGQPASVLTGIAYSTGEQRMMALRTIAPASLSIDKPLVVAVARDLPTIFAEWRRDAFARAGLYCLLLVSASIGLYSYQQRQRAYERLLANLKAEREQEETRIRQANEDLRQLNEALESRTSELEKSNARFENKTRELAISNQELEQFAYATSHDLQEPLRTVIGFVQLLERRLGDKLDGENREFMSCAVGGALRMQGLIRDILTYSQIGSRGKPYPQIDSATAVRDALAGLGDRISNAGAEVETANLPTVAADRTQLIQLFQNLIGNAIKFCKPMAPRVRIAAVQDGDHWRFTVSDNGVGIKPEDRHRIFGIFQRLHTAEEFEGSGIGLAICKRIVDRHGGEIGVGPVPGGGSAFWFTLPADQGESLRTPS